MAKWVRSNSGVRLYGFKCLLNRVLANGSFGKLYSIGVPQHIHL